ncbi:class I SAM-dependent methyltransferase [Tateyamaria sp.]|uniref:class I SAM-dependent methyltransferase n=1 Tax=Tateyamaria sp. TaxID=1929288 RepID=UPI00329D026C
MSNVTGEYWNAYYAEKKKPAVPSQFATFVLNEFSHIDRFIDIGCGDGRDSLFFATYGKEVLGLDGSSSAVDFCTKTATDRGLRTASFDTLNLDDANAIQTFAQQGDASSQDAIVYARFFLHAINETAQENFLTLAASLIGENGRVCLEFRTPRDEFQTKVTAAHYRRYVDPIALILEADKHGLDCAYMAEGFGFAKYKSDDAYVARIVFQKRC